MDKRDNLDWRIIRRKVEGKLTVEEERQLREWIGRDLRRQAFIKSVEKYYAAEDLPVVLPEQVDNAWQRFHASAHRAGKSFYRRVIRWSMAAILLLGIGTGLWWYLSGGAVPEVQVSGHILPGSKKACLVLSTGEIIDLDQVRQQQWSDRQAQISCDTSGQIVYEQMTESREPAFNILRIPRGGEYTLTLSDGTRVWLNAKTDITYPVVFTGMERRVKLNGEAYFEVAHNEKQPFIVETDKMEVKVLGTSFNVNAYQDEPEIVTTLVTGQIEIQQAGVPVWKLFPDEQAIWKRGSGEIAVNQVNTSAFVQWRDGKFVFRDHDLESILRILSRWYDMEYEFRQPELKKEKFYGVISRYADIRELLEQFEKTGKVHFECKDKKVIVKK